jgi:hypothetical protein
MSLTSSNHESKSGQKSSSIATTTTTPTKTIKNIPGKIEKKVKHQFHRLSGVLHHVIHPHHHTVRTPAFSVTSPSSPIFYPINVVRAFLPPDHLSSTGSVHSRESWDVKYPKEDDSIDELLADDSIDLSLSVADSSITQIEEHHLPQKEPQLILHEQDSPSVPTVTSPIEIPEPVLVDDEEEKGSPSEEVDEEKVSSDANSQQVLPPQAVDLDVPSSPNASTPQLEPEITDFILIDDNEEKDLPSKEPAEEKAPSDADPQQASSPQAVPLDLPSSPDASTPQLQPEIPDPILIDDNVEKESLPKEEADEKAPLDANSQQVSPSQAVPFDLPSLPDNSTPRLEPEILDSILIADKEEKNSPSKEEVDEEKALSDANSQQDVSPSQAVPTVLSPSPEASIPQHQAALPNVQKDIPPPSEKDLDVPAFVVPPTFLPIPNIHRSFSSNLLTWWLPVSPLTILPVSQHFSSLRRILTSRRLWLLLLLLLIRDSTAPLAAVETIALFATF